MHTHLAQNCELWCPNCGHELLSRLSKRADEHGGIVVCMELPSGLTRFGCTCTHATEWLMDAPVPLLVNGKLPVNAPRCCGPHTPRYREGPTFFERVASWWRGSLFARPTRAAIASGTPRAVATARLYAEPARVRRVLGRMPGWEHLG